MKSAFQKKFILLILAAYMGVFAGMMTLVIDFRREFLANHRAEELSYVVGKEIQELNALEWQAIARQTMDAELMTNIDNQRTTLSEALNGLVQFDPDEKRLELLQQIYANYKQATDEEFGLISSGRMEEALVIDEERSDPLSKQLDSTVVETTDFYSNEALEKSRLALLVIVLATAFSSFFASLLVWIYYRSQRKHHQLSAEKTILELSEERFRSVAQSANEAIITIDEQGRITYWNSAAAHMFGYEEDKVLGQPVSFIMPERFREAHLAGMKRVVTTGETKIAGSTVEFSGLKKAGSEFPIEVSRSRWQSQQGTFFTAIIRDITERKQALAQLASQTNKLEQGNLQLGALFEVGATISGTIELQQLLESALVTIVASGVLQVQHKGGILLVKDNKLTLVSHLGHPEEFLDLHKEIAIGECLCGLAMERGEIIISDDSSSDDRHTISYSGMEPHGHVIVPLKARDRVVGVMYLYTPPGTHVDEGRKRLFATIGGQLGVAIENALLFEKTKELSLHDPLTGLANRSLMNIELRKNFAAARRTKRPLSLIMLDLDHFKNYNDTYGHPAGDQLLADIAAIITSQMRETDLVVRYGGEEFLIILPETDSPAALQIAERIRTTIMQTEFFFAGKQKPRHITVSQGVATYDQTVEVDKEDRLIVMADEALYQAKRAGRNRVEVYKRPGDDATQP